MADTEPKAEDQVMHGEEEDKEEVRDLS